MRQKNSAKAKKSRMVRFHLVGRDLVKDLRFESVAREIVMAVLQPVWRDH